MLKTIAIVGSKGMLGSDLVKKLSHAYSVSAINRESYNSYIGGSFDVVINANGNSKRFWANQHPVEDFFSSTVSVYKTIFDFTYQTYIYISSSDVYEKHSSKKYTSEEQQINIQNLSSYGLHKYISELLIRKYAKNYLILRSSMILGASIKKGPFYDILHNKELFIAKTSRLQLITTEEIANIIAYLIIKKVSGKIINMGGTGVFSFLEIGKYFQKPIAFSKGAKLQEYEMNVTKLKKIFPLRTSIEYLLEFISRL